MSEEFIQKFAKLQISRATAQPSPKPPAQPQPAAKPASRDVKRKSHEFLNAKRLQKIDDLGAGAHHLKVLYLQHNAIRRIANLGRLRNLTHLYLQRNRIERIEGLDGLVGLQKLYLGMNEISVLENLGGLPSLVELHVERQNWASKQQLCGVAADGDCAATAFTVDRACIDALAPRLRVLNVTGLCLRSLAPFAQLFRLERLHAAENAFGCPRELGQQLAAFARLRSADMRDCPAQRRDVHYKVAVLEAAHQLQELDGLLVPERTRTFCRDFAQAKLQRQRSRTSASSKEQEREKQRGTEATKGELSRRAADEAPAFVATTVGDGLRIAATSGGGGASKRVRMECAD